MDRLKVAAKYFEKLLLPALAIFITIDFWDTVNKGIIMLLFLYLFLGVLEKLDIKFKPLERFKLSKFGKLLIRLIRSLNPVLKYTTEQADETSELIANGLIEGKKQVEKMKEEIKVKERFKIFKLNLKFNKSVVTGYVLAALYILEVVFHWATKLGIPAEALPYIAVFIVGFIFYVMFGEGFTFSDINEIREAATQAKKDALIAIGSTNREIEKVDKRIKELTATWGNRIPAEYAEEWNILNLKKDKLQLALDGLKDDLEKAKKLIKTGKKE